MLFKAVVWRRWPQESRVECAFDGASRASLERRTWMKDEEPTGTSSKTGQSERMQEAKFLRGSGMSNSFGSR